MKNNDNPGCCGVLFGMFVLYVLVVWVVVPLILALVELVVFLVSKVLLGIVYLLLAAAIIGVAAGAIALATLLISWALSCFNDLKADADHDVNPVAFLAKLFILMGMATVTIILVIQYAIAHDLLEYLILISSLIASVAIVFGVISFIKNHPGAIQEMILEVGSVVKYAYQWVLSFENDLLPPPGHRVKPLELVAKLVIVFGLIAFSVIWIVERFFR